MSDIIATSDLAMPGLKITIALTADEIQTQWWSKLPYRHLEVEVSVFNGTENKTGEVTFEVGFPEESTFDLNGAAWHPSHRHELDGASYVVWSTLPGVGRYHAESGVWISPGGLWRQRLTVNLKPYTITEVVLRRLFEDGDPITEWIKEELPLQPFEPQL